MRGRGGSRQESEPGSMKRPSSVGTPSGARQARGGGGLGSTRGGGGASAARWPTIRLTIVSATVVGGIGDRVPRRHGTGGSGDGGPGRPGPPWVGGGGGGGVGGGRRG